MKYESKWDGRLGEINIAKHCILLNSMDVPPIHFAPYCAGPSQYKLLRKIIEKIWEAGVPEPAIAEWTSILVFMPKKIATYSFASITNISVQSQNETAIQAHGGVSVLIC